MQLHQQPTAELDDDTRHYTRMLADLCKRDPSCFAAMVRASDQMRAVGVPEDEVRRQILNALRA